MKVKWTPRALRNLKAIGDYIRQDNPEAAKKTLQQIRRRAANLTAYPHLGHAGRVPDTREYLVAPMPYILAYQVTGDRLEILAVIHGARDWPESF